MVTTTPSSAVVRSSYEADTIWSASVQSFNRLENILGGPKSKNASRDHDLAAFGDGFGLSLVRINLRTKFEVCNSTRYEDMNGDGICKNEWFGMNLNDD